MRYEHYDPNATIKHGIHWQRNVKDALAVIDNAKVRKAIFIALDETKSYADNEDENVSGSVNALETRFDDGLVDEYDDSELRQYIDQLETRIKKLEALLNV